MTKNPALYMSDEEGNYTFSDKVSSDQIVQLALGIMEGRVCTGQKLSSPKDAVHYLSLELGDLEHEVFCCLFLDTKHRVLSLDQLFTGTIDGTTIHPREVVKAALKHNAQAMIVAHNHPSGCAEPSRADEVLTRRLKDALALVDVRLLDHIVVAKEGAVSLAERGLM